MAPTTLIARGVPSSPTTNSAIAEPLKLSTLNSVGSTGRGVCNGTGIESLLAAVGRTAAQVDRVLIAGSFGFHLRTASLIHLGLLPREFADRVEFVGNTSKSGARAFLLNRRTREHLGRTVTGVQVLELANDAAFQRTFVDALAFAS